MKFVVDADIAASASDSEKDEPKHSRDFLEALYTHRHEAVFSDQLWAEWEKHESKFSHEWRVRMVRRGLIQRLKDTHDQTLRDQIEQAQPDQHIVVILLKDTHLIEAAVKSDQRIASKDKVRKHFSNLCGQIKALQSLLWVNPHTENCLDWLEQGAPAEAERMLCGS